MLCAALINQRFLKFLFLKSVFTSEKGEALFSTSTTLSLAKSRMSDCENPKMKMIIAIIMNAVLSSLFAS